MHSDLKQIGAAYKSYAYDPKKKLYSPGLTNMDGKLEYSDAPYDYTVPDCTDSDGPRTIWYHLPIKEGPSWQEPYFATQARELLAEYGTSFEGIDASNRKRGKIGIIYANFSLSSVRQMVGKLNLGNTGYGFIVTPKGTIVSHPIKEYLGKRIETVNDNTLKEIVIPLGLPYAIAVILLAAIDPILDPVLTTVNVYGNCAATALIARREKGRNALLENEEVSTL